MTDNIYTVGIHIEKDMDAVFDFVSNIDNLDQWTISSSKFVNIEKDLCSGKMCPYGKAETFLRMSVNSEAKIIDWYWGGEPDKLFHYHPMRFVSAEKAINKKGTFALWSGFRHPSIDLDVWELQSTVHRVELLNLKNAMEKSQEHDLSSLDFTCTTSIDIDVPIDFAHEYISNIYNLHNWTLHCTDITDIGARVYKGTASAYKSGLYYKSVSDDDAKLTDWYCGPTKELFPHFYPTRLVESKDAFGKSGCVFIWTGFAHPYMPPHVFRYMDEVHTFETKRLKKDIENNYKTKMD